jgi:hypothetical protein
MEWRNDLGLSDEVGTTRTSPTSSPTAPITTTAKEKNNDEDDQQQFHGNLD